MTIPYGRQTIEEDDIQAVVEVLRSDYLTTGPNISDFEKAVCEYTGTKYAVAISNVGIGVACRYEQSLRYPHIYNVAPPFFTYDSSPDS